MELPLVEMFVCSNDYCPVAGRPVPRQFVTLQPFDKKFYCAQCGGEVTLGEDRKAEWVSVAFYVYSEGQFHRVDSTVRAFESGDWPQAILYHENLIDEDGPEFTWLDLARPMIFVEKLPPETVSEDDAATL